MLLFAKSITRPEVTLELLQFSLPTVQEGEMIPKPTYNFHVLESKQTKTPAYFKIGF